jgi:hypothetical protein
MIPKAIGPIYSIYTLQNIELGFFNFIRCANTSSFFTLIFN